MKKLLAIGLCLILLFCFVGCNDNKPSENGDDPKTHVESGVEISTDAFPEDTVLKVEAIKAEDQKYTVIKTALPQALKLEAYEITAKSEGVSVQPDGSVKVVFPIPAEYDSAKHDIAVYFVADDGTTELISSTVEKNGVAASLKHFSTYVVILTEKNPTVESQPESSVSSVPEPTTSEPVNSIPVIPEPTPSVPVVVTPNVPTLSENVVMNMMNNFFWATKFSYTETESPYPDFYQKSDFKDLDPLTVLSFIYRYDRNALIDYQNIGTPVVTKVPITVLNDLANKYLNYSYEFAKDYSGYEYHLTTVYDASTKTITFTEEGGFGDPDGFVFDGFTQSGDTCTVSAYYRTLTDQKPDGVENVDWIDITEEGSDPCYFEISNRSVITLKYIDSAWKFVSWLDK